jgi:hypothetical protein
MDNAQRRAVRPQSHGAAWAYRAIILTVLAAAISSVTASRAEAGPGSIVRQFMCPLPVIGTQPVTISVVRPGLDTATVGVPTPHLRITATATMAAAARLVVSFLCAEWAQGTGVMTGEVESPQGLRTESMPFTVPRTDIATGSGPLSVSGFGILPSTTFSRPGGGEILATRLTVRFSLLNPAGGQTWLSPFSITCTLAPGQSDTVASFRILPAPARSRDQARGTAPISPRPRPTPSPAPRPSPSSVTSRPAPAPSQAPSPPSRPSPSSFSSCLLWPVMVVAVAGLGGAAWWLQRRWLAQRPAR